MPSSQGLRAAQDQSLPLHVVLLTKHESSEMQAVRGSRPAKQKQLPEALADVFFTASIMERPETLTPKNGRRRKENCRTTTFLQASSKDTEGKMTTTPLAPRKDFGQAQDLQK